ncbi:glycosyltransferase [Microbacterium sp. GXF0217]
MSQAPHVSIVIPVFNDEDVIANALDSCLRQTLDAIEVIVVDDASTDDTVRIVEEYQARDRRVHLIRQTHNTSAFQARRSGILAAQAAHLLFLDGDDELAKHAAETAFLKATSTGADLVQFGVEVVQLDGSTGGAFESRLQPKHASLSGRDVIHKLFPQDRPAQGQLWRYLFRTQLLLDAYALLPADLILPRVNDLPVMFLTAAIARHLESIPERLYRYHFGRGSSGRKVRDLDTASFYASAIHSIDSIEPAVRHVAGSGVESEDILATYASTRRAIIAYTTHYLADHSRPDLLPAVLADLYSRASPRDIVQSTATHWPQDIDTLAAHADAIDLAERPVRRILLATNHLRTGGISGVIISQARVLQESGVQVLIVARETGSDASGLPAGVRFVEVTDETLGSALSAWSDLCVQNEIDLVIDHQWQYSTSWQAFALAARAAGVPTIGWSHNFAGRSLLLGLDRLQRAPLYFPLLSHLVVLSPLDVAFWKLRGMPRVSYLPNPPSSLMVTAGLVSSPRRAPEGRPVELIWWGRLQERTKRVSELLRVAEHLERMGVDFRMRIIGPDWRDMSAARLNAQARKQGLGSRVQAVGPLRGAELMAAIDDADIFVSTSFIEGYPLTIPEAQARGLPVAMYDLPWLAIAEGNGGLAIAPQRDPHSLASRIAAIVTDPGLYTTMSAASVTAAKRELGYDFAALYRQLMTGTLPRAHSPRPTLRDVEQLVDLVIEFAEQRSRLRSREMTAPASDRRSPGMHEGRRSWQAAVLRAARPIAHGILRVAPWLRPNLQVIKHLPLRR